MPPEIEDSAGRNIDLSDRQVNSTANQKMSLEGQAGNFGLGNTAASSAEEHLPPFEVVDIPTENGREIAGILWKPPGEGPFPAVVFNHGSEALETDKNYAEIASFYVSNGFEFLMPLRSGHSYVSDEQVVASSDGVLFQDRVYRDSLRSDSETNSEWMKAQESENEDVVAAAKWLANEPTVDRNRIIMSGISFGGIQTVLSAEKDLGMQAYIPFAPAAMSWEKVPQVQERLETALENAQAPVFLIQAENDYSIAPSEQLGPVLDQNGSQNRHKVYPPFEIEKGHAGGHAEFALHGMELWQEDVSDFLQELEVVKKPIEQTP